MLGEMSDEQYQEWQAFEQLEGFGEQRADTRTQLLALCLVESIVSQRCEFDFSRFDLSLLHSVAAERSETTAGATEDELLMADLRRISQQAEQARQAKGI